MFRVFPRAVSLTWSDADDATDACATSATLPAAAAAWLGSAVVAAVTAAASAPSCGGTPDKGRAPSWRTGPRGAIIIGPGRRAPLCRPRPTPAMAAPGTTKPMHGAAVAMTNMLAPRRAPASSMTLRVLGLPPYTSHETHRL